MVFGSWDIAPAGACGFVLLSECCVAPEGPERRGVEGCTSPMREISLVLLSF